MFSFSSQSSSAASTSQLQTPPPAMTHAQSNIVDDFFGGSTSRHDRPLSGAHSEMAMPPPYAGEDSDLPVYSRTAAEPVTLAMFLFKFGFREFTTICATHTSSPDKCFFFQYSFHSGSSAPASSYPHFAHLPHASMKRECPLRGSLRRPKPNARTSSTGCAPLKSNGHEGAFGPYSSSSSSFPLAPSHAGCCYDDNPKSLLFPNSCLFSGPGPIAVPSRYLSRSRSPFAFL